MGDNLVELTRWARRGDFSPVSSKQVLSYCKARGYDVPLHRKTRRPTTNDEALTRILQRVDDPVLESVLRSRHLSKAIGYLYDTFLGRDGRLHPLYTYIPKTGRLSSKAPNLMNLPQGRKGDIMAEAAQAIRESFIPFTDDMVFVEFDWKNIEALLVGYFAGDSDYMRLSRLGSHAYFALHGLGRPPDMSKSDAELTALFDEVKEKEPQVYLEFKKANLSNNYGQGVRNMAKDLQISVARAKEIKDIMERAAPKVAQWKRETQLRAHSEGQLVNPFGYSCSFFEVLKKRPDGKWGLGKEANECLAFPAQSTGAAMLREVLCDMGEDPREDKEFFLLVPTHDSILLAVYKRLLNQIIPWGKTLMEREWAELGGLKVEVGVKVGRDMKELKTWRG